MKKTSGASQRFLSSFQKPHWLSIVVMLLSFALLAAGMVLATSPERYNLSVGGIAPSTITATKDVVDEVTTEQRRDRAAEQVQPSYKEDESAVELVLEHLDVIFQDYAEIRTYGEDLREGTIPSVTGEPFTYGGSFLTADLEYARQLSEHIPLSNWQATLIMRQSDGDFEELTRNIRETVLAQMESTIREGQIDTAISSIQRQILQNSTPEIVLTVAIPTVRAVLVPNMVVDQEATEANREIARQDAEPFYYKSGQNIVVSGERVTAAQLSVLESLGLLEGNRFDVMMMTGVVLLSLLLMVALLFDVLQFDRALLSLPRNALLLAMIFLVATVVCVLAAKVNPYLLPVSMVVLLVASLLSPSMALTANTLAVILISVLTNNANSTFAQQMLYIVVSGTLSAPVGIYIVVKLRNQRTSVLAAGLVMAVVNTLAMIAMGLLTNNELRTVLDNAVWSAGGTVMAAVLCMGAQPVLEWAFNLVTPFKLVELSNPNQPLLRRLLVETPGTYHHSIMVANLAEAAAEAVGADSLLARVGAYYHDIGKLNRPLFFKENQLGDNPHDRTDPRVSAAIITGHVTDGMQLARQHRLPRMVSDFIAQHHGDSVVRYFYHKMCNMEGGADAHIEDFQYGGPKPQTSETAIVMLADIVEAAIRAGGDQPSEVIETRVRELVKGVIDSGQLNDSPLCFADVQRIVGAFTQVLTGIYHKRIEYPQLSPQGAALPAAGGQTEGTGRNAH